jgi:hypothetical protein
MRNKFEAIPFDVWHQIASRLDPWDYIHLSSVNWRMYDLLRNELTARKSVQVSHPDKILFCGPVNANGYSGIPC